MIAALELAPHDAAQGQGFADLYTALRTAFDALAAQKGDTTPYELTVAVSAGAANFANLVVPQMNSGACFTRRSLFFIPI